MSRTVIHAPSRRSLLQQAACGFGMVALADLCHRQSSAASIESEVSHPRPNVRPMHRQRAKRIIFVYMQGGPSHVDSFDYKPRLAQDDGHDIEFKLARTREVKPQRILKSPWIFRQHGACGRWVSSLFPHMARHVDDACVIRSMHTEGVAHGPSTLFLHTGATNLIRPSMGAWVSYGLGTENHNLPTFITICPTMAKGGPRNYSNGFLPTVYQGTAIGRAGTAAKSISVPNIRNPVLTDQQQAARFDVIRRLNSSQLRRRGDDGELNAVISSFELAWRMQTRAPEILDLSGETRGTQSAYGIGEEPTDDFGRQCLLARRMAEAGVRYIQINYADNQATPRWDQHSNLMKHELHAAAVDKPFAGLLADLKQRGLLEDTLVWWGGEFGRTPFAQGRDGRDHNPNGFSVWLAGGGVQRGIAYGETDDHGYHAVTDRVHMHDLHATILHLLGLDHERLTWRHAGRDFRLTDIHGRVVHDILA